MDGKTRFCAICERRLGEADSEHVCRSCFRKAREHKETSIHLSEEGAQRLGLAYALGSFVNWGVQKLIEASGANRPPEPKTPEEAVQREVSAREKLRGIQERLNGDPSEKEVRFLCDKCRMSWCYRYYCGCGSFCYHCAPTKGYGEITCPFCKQTADWDHIDGPCDEI